MDWKTIGHENWNFTKSAAKNYYNEGDETTSRDNPVFDIEFTGTPVTDTHHPNCGYWPRVTRDDEINVNIYSQYAAGGMIWAVNFDGTTLTEVGWYLGQVSHYVDALVVYNGSLLTISHETGAAVEFTLINAYPELGVLNIIDTYTPFVLYDARDPIESCLSYDADTGELYYSDPYSYGGTIVRFSDLSTKVSRGWTGTVIEGTDSNLYVYRSYATVYMWNADKKPITGAFWANYWSVIPDNINDGPTITYGDTDPLSKHGSWALKTRHIVKDGFIYVCSDETNAPAVKKYDRITYELLAVSTSHVAHSIFIYDDIIYTVGGFTSCTVYSFDLSTLSDITSVALPKGRYGDLVVMGDKLIVVTLHYTTDSAIYKLNLTTLAIEDSLTLPAAELHQKILKIDEKYLAVGLNKGVAIFDIDNMARVCDLTHTESTYDTHNMVYISNI